MNVSLERSVKVFKAYCELRAYSWPTVKSLKLPITRCERMWSVLLAYCELTINVGSAFYEMLTKTPLTYKYCTGCTKMYVLGDYFNIVRGLKDAVK